MVVSKNSLISKTEAMKRALIDIAAEAWDELEERVFSAEANSTSNRMKAVLEREGWSTKN